MPWPALDRVLLACADATGGDGMIEPMSIEELKTFLCEIDYRYFPSGVSDIKGKIMKLLLAWVLAEARARQAEYQIAWREHEVQHLLGNPSKPPVNVPYYCDNDWIAAVKAEVGWPKD